MLACLATGLPCLQVWSKVGLGYRSEHVRLLPDRSSCHGNLSGIRSHIRAHARTHGGTPPSPRTQPHTRSKWHLRVRGSGPGRPPAPVRLPLAEAVDADRPELSCLGPNLGPWEEWNWNGSASGAQGVHRWVGWLRGGWTTWSAVGKVYLRVMHR